MMGRQYMATYALQYIALLIIASQLIIVRSTMTGFNGHDKQTVYVAPMLYNTSLWYIIIICTPAHTILYTHYTYAVP